jgi:hypothetical protein
MTMFHRYSTLECAWMPPYQVRGRLIKSGMTIDMFNYQSNRNNYPVGLNYLNLG